MTFSIECSRVAIAAGYSTSSDAIELNSNPDRRILCRTYTLETDMADDLNNRGAQDRSRIAMGEEHEVRYWTEALGVTKEELQRAVDQVGNGADAVREYLKK